MEDIGVELVSGGSDIDGATPPSLGLLYLTVHYCIIAPQGPVSQTQAPRDSTVAAGEDGGGLGGTEIQPGSLQDVVTCPVAGVRTKDWSVCLV